MIFQTIQTTVHAHGEQNNRAQSSAHTNRPTTPNRHSVAGSAPPPPAARPRPSERCPLLRSHQLLVHLHSADPRGDAVCRLGWGRRSSLPAYPQCSCGRFDFDTSGILSTITHQEAYRSAHSVAAGDSIRPAFYPRSQKNSATTQYRMVQDVIIFV